MKTSHKALLALITGCFLSVSAQAAMSYGNGQPYIGAKIGQVSLDDEGLDSYDEATAFGVYGGYKFTPSWGTYNYAFPNTALYAKAKLGVAKVEAEVNIGGGSSSESESGLAGGIGLGYSVTPKVNVEGEYSMIDGDFGAKLLTIGATYKF